LLVGVLVVGACSGGKGAQAASGVTTPTTGSQVGAASSTVPAPATTVLPRQVTLPADPCSVLAATDVNRILSSGWTPVPRPRIASGSVTTIACAWKKGISTLSVEADKDTGGDAFAARAKTMRDARPVPGFVQALETDNLATNPAAKRVVILIRDGDAAIEVMANLIGPLTVASVLSVAQSALLHF
jgi:hypothetical protein